MATTIEHDSRTELLAQVTALLRTKVTPGERNEVEDFVRRFYEQVDDEDLAGRAPPDLYGAALSQWTFAQMREAGQAKVRVLNPSRAEHGWQSTHTVIQIVNDDMPFLVDSVSMEVNRHGLTLHLIIHPILNVIRDSTGALVGLAAKDAPEGRPESFIHAEVDRIIDTDESDALATDLLRILGDVRAAVSDWQAMTSKLQEIVAEVRRRPPPLPVERISEDNAFLDWLAANHFTFLGYRCHDLVNLRGEDALRIVPGSSLGIMRERPGGEVAARFAALPPGIRAYARRPELLVITKSTSRSTVHHSGYLDYIGIKRFDARGNVYGEHRFLGLFTSMAYSADPITIPLLRRKIEHVIARAAFPQGSHADKSLVNVLKTYPRDELFQIEEDELYRTAVAILQLGERQRLRLFVRRDPFERFLTCLIYAPRDTYSTELRQKWQQILTETFNGTSSEFTVNLSDSVLARIMITVRTTPGRIPDYDSRQLEQRLAAAARRWDDDLRDALIETQGEAYGNELFRRYRGAFPAGYREQIDARSGVSDIEMISRLDAGESLALSLHQPVDGAPRTLRFKVFRKGSPVTLSDSLPMLERMGFRVLDERPHTISPKDSPPVWMHDFGIQATAANIDVDVRTLHAIFEDAFARVFHGDVENDDFNRLVAAARLPAGDVVVLRAYAKYLRQIGFALSQAFIEATLAAHPGVARRLVELFKLRFDPQEQLGDRALVADLESHIQDDLEKVQNLSEDRVLRQYLALIGATTRTNFWRRDDAGSPRSFLSFKFDPARIPGLPEPRPMFEIFVYSTRFEGVHLRGGRIARGGLRWSDRPEDFRTEVLGLVKAQMVKNTVIVPVGSKGGFVLKRAPPPTDREAFMSEGVACYKDYLRALLDLTDNRASGAIVPPPQVVRHDADDPYLVVAADKGTATFSDYANAISKEYGFWLGDAFASGGSVGYDHKAMGITARGAWEAVKRHFRELGVDTQTTPFTVAGIGDMSGDVFGNGMLLSRFIQLVAAFDHRHIFLDPTPDVAKSFAERERLFRLPRSSWADYDTSLISAGGGVYPRTAKSIALSPEVKRVLALDADVMTPSELIHAILKAPVDLLYNGGVGTYVKATHETHADVGDRNNDAVRVNGRELRCKVVAEGGNLGATQLGRVEFALAGGRINTDAIDNSAGVDTSDHEVNIKILLGLVIAEGALTLAERDSLLDQMTDDVAALVLRDNYFQTQVLSVTRRIAAQLFDAQQRFIVFLEKSGRLNRALEYLPSDEEMAERRRAGIGLTSPESAVLLAYSKMWMYDEVLASTLPDDEFVATAIGRYFPKLLGERYAAYMARHPLKREIIATHTINSMGNRVGSTFVHRLCETTGAKPHEVVRAYLLTREIFEFVPLWRTIEALDNRVDDAVQAALLLDSSQLIDRGTVWFLRSRRLADDMWATIARFAPGVKALQSALPKLLDAEDSAQLEASVARRVAEGAPRDVAAHVATLDRLYAILDIIEESASRQRPVEAVARIYFDLATRLRLSWLREKIAALPADQHWRLLAKRAMLDDLSTLQRKLTGEVLSGAASSPPALIAAWQETNRRSIERVEGLLTELRTAPSADAAMLSVALRELRNLTID